MWTFAQIYLPAAVGDVRDKEDDEGHVQLLKSEPSWLDAGIETLRAALTN